MQPYEIIEDFLKSDENLDALKAYVANNIEAQSYLDEALYGIAQQDSLYEDNIRQYKMLLKAGANANYILESNQKSTLQAAAAKGNDALILALLEAGANPVLYVPEKSKNNNQDPENMSKISNMAHEDKIQEMRQRGKLPLQICINENFAYSRSEKIIKSCDILTTKTFSALNLEPKINDIFKSLYQELAEQFHKRYIDAKKQGKQFIVMIGESHSGIPSLVIELMLMNIAKAYGINTVLTEHNKYIVDCLNKNGWIPTNRGNESSEWSCGVIVHQQCQRLQMKHIPVDLGHWGEKKTGPNFDNYEYLKSSTSKFDERSPEGIKYRNQVMHNVITKGHHDDALLLVGAAHIYGLMEELPFPDLIAVMAISPENKLMEICKTSK